MGMCGKPMIFGSVIWKRPFALARQKLKKSQMASFCFSSKASAITGALMSLPFGPKPTILP